MKANIAIFVAVVAVVIAAYAAWPTTSEVMLGSVNSGNVTNYSGLGLTAAPVCFQFYATSTATLVHLTASTTGVLPVGAAAAMTADYGNC